ncbi:Late secretory pathway protein AVL9 [Ceratocystis fimbriata CBS 114723]|uniref:Late secretory pathway protein AVL9 n=1 Tax=Ceratocystis fimbriata CBS 114723 TaxID=1035309 RepID=A0A2C5WVZ8_9PEZI|nr:Late secretory pathway protein AVL9 [Ceratocystis fimbriata CBS 114723]
MSTEEPIDPWKEPQAQTEEVAPTPEDIKQTLPSPPSPASASPPRSPLPNPNSASITTSAADTVSTPPVSSPPAAASTDPAPIPAITPVLKIAPGVLSQIEPSTPSTPSQAGFIPLVSVVDFHHARGPEVEYWFGADEGQDPAAEYGWSLLPFMALSDGAHASSEDFSYFTLLRPESPMNGPAISLFGIACTRQLDSTMLKVRPPDVTRSTVQKAVVVITDSPQHFGMLRERLSIVTQAWFAQREFTDVEILHHFQESLADDKRRGMMAPNVDGGDQYLGLSLREFVHEFKWQTLVLLKCCLLQPKMLFFGTRCDRLCMVQFCLISLIPRLIRSMQDCADPDLNAYEKTLAKSVSFRSSDRASTLAFMGLPLQIFGKGALFGPYTPLQQLDVLADVGTKSYIVGSTNSLLLQQRDRYSDILINLDENTINITSSSLRSALSLTAADRRWIDFLTQAVNDTWDDANPANPTNLQYMGSEAFIRMQFEEYIIAMLSSVRYHLFIQKDPSKRLAHIDGDPALDFGLDWIEAWTRTENHRMWYTHTDDAIFDVVEPRHPCAGGLTIDDVQRRISEQVKELHLDDKLAQGKEAIGRNWAAGKDRASAVVNKFWTDMEAFRELQRKKAEEEKQKAAEARTQSQGPEQAPNSAKSSNQSTITDEKAPVMTVGERASSYMSSWASWAGEKRKTGGGWGFGRKTSPNTPTNSDSPPSGNTATSTDSGYNDKTRDVSSSPSAPAGHYRSLHTSNLSGSSFELAADIHSDDDYDDSRAQQIAPTTSRVGSASTTTATAAASPETVQTAGALDTKS